MQSGRRCHSDAHQYNNGRSYAMNVMRLAIEDAEMSTEDVDYVNVHGTSTYLEMLPSHYQYF